MNTSNSFANPRVIPGLALALIMMTVGARSLLAAPFSSEEAKRAAQNDMAPHSIMIETSLRSALENLKGLRAEMKVNKDHAPSEMFIAHYKMLGHDFNKDIKTIQVHENELRGSVEKHPRVANSSDFKSVVPSINDLSRMNQEWQAKMSDQTYWKDAKVVKNDIDRMENQINTALDHTKTFNSKQLDVSNVD